MDHALPRLPPLSLDPKRITATAGVIALHALVLMLLLLPAQRPASAPTADEVSMIVVPEVRRIPKPIPLPKPIERRTAPVPAPRPIIETVTPVDTSPSPVDQYVPPQPVDVAPNNFGAPTPTPSFVQIVADVSPAPPYPVQALKRRLAGEVMLRVRIDARGRPVEASIESSSGSRLLDEAARKFVLARWHFLPATQDGAPIEAQALIPINFVLQ